MTEAQVGYVWGKSRQAVGNCKRKWLPKWGYAGKVIIDLELYEDCVELERPDQYYENKLGNVGLSVAVRTF